MIPTPRADAIAPTISTLLQLADNDLAVKPEFLPQQSQRNFTIGMTDISCSTLPPLLIANCAPAAGGGRVHFFLRYRIWMSRPSTPSNWGNAISPRSAYLTQLPESVYQQHLFDQS